MVETVHNVVFNCTEIPFYLILLSTIRCAKLSLLRYTSILDLERPCFDKPIDLHEDWYPNYDDNVT